MLITKILFCITATIIVITSEIAGITLMFMFSPLVAVAYMLGI